MATPGAWLEVLARFTRLGLTSFGGPIAHLGYFRREFVERERWLEDRAFGEIVALASVLPGPTSSQVGILLGTLRAGPLGGFLAWLAFTTPSALALAVFGLMLRAARAQPHGAGGSAAFAGALQGLTGVAAAVVALAVFAFFRSVARTVRLRAIAALGLVLALPAVVYAPAFTWLALLAGGVAGIAALRHDDVAPLPPAAHLPSPPRAVAASAAAGLALLLLGLPLVAPPESRAASFAAFFRAGSLVFGGGHAVLPFLQTTLGNDRVPVRDFFAGYAAAQAVPGPLFSFAAFLGADDRAQSDGRLGAAVALLGIFAPSFLLLTAVVPLWHKLRMLPRAAAALGGLNAAVVGLLAAVLFGTLLPAVVRSPVAVVCSVVAAVLLTRFAWPAWAVVALGAAGGAVLGRAAGTFGA